MQSDRGSFIHDPNLQIPGGPPPSPAPVPVPVPVAPTVTAPAPPPVPVPLPLPPAPPLTLAQYKSAFRRALDVRKELLVGLDKVDATNAARLLDATATELFAACLEEVNDATMDGAL